MVLRLDEHAHLLAARDPPDDLRVRPGDRPEPARPVRPVVRPPDPRRLVRLPLRGQAQARRGRRPRTPPAQRRPPHAPSSRKRRVMPS